MKAIVGPGNEGNLVKGGRLFLSPILLIVEKRSVKKSHSFILILFIVVMV